MSGKNKTANQTSYLILLFVMFFVLKFKVYQHITASLLANVFLVYFPSLIPKGAKHHTCRMKTLCESQTLFSKNTVCVQARTTPWSRTAPLNVLRVLETTTQGTWLQVKNNDEGSSMPDGRHNPVSILRVPLHSISKSDKVQRVCEQPSSAGGS